MVQTRSRKSRQVKLSRRTPGRKKLNIPPELRAPMTTEIEENLENLERWVPSLRNANGTTGNALLMPSVVQPARDERSR